MLVRLCPTQNIAYKVEIKNDTNNNQKRYLGSSKIAFKRCSNHTRDFKHRNYEKHIVFQTY